MSNTNTHDGIGLEFWNLTIALLGQDLQLE